MGNACKSSELEDLEINLELYGIYNKFKEIKEIRKQIAMMNVFKRKQIAKEEYLIFLKEESNNINIKITDKEKIKNKYIKIMRLLLIDNTNKDIVKLYLNFIKNNPDFIEENELMPYELEIDKYKILFTILEMEKIEKRKKNKTQKTIFLDYINYICLKVKEDDENISKYIRDSAHKKLKDLFIFNTPIEFDNEELLYYKYYYNLLLEISKQEDNKITYYLEQRKKVMEYIIKHDLYNNEQITSNEDKMNLLTLYLMEEKFKISFKEGDSINFNRLMQKMPVTKEDFEEMEKKDENTLFLKEGKAYKLNQLIKSEKDSETTEKNGDPKEKCDKKQNYIVKRSLKILNINNKVVEKNTLKIPLQNACIQNLINRKLINKKKRNYFYTLDELMITNEISPYIKDIKDFLLKIIDSNAYQQAIKKLFPDYYQSLNSNENENIKQFIKERIKFYPFQDLDLSGITDKLSCYSFIPTIKFEVEDKKNFRIDAQNKDTYKIGITIDNSLHEINHANQMIIFFKGSNKELINSPKRNNIKENVNISEGGISLEYLLFGRIIRKMNLLECLYIMNEKNYEQDLDEFKNNFINIIDIVKNSKENTEYIKIENGIFKRFYDNSVSEIKDIIGLLSTKDSSEGSEDNSEIVLPMMFIGKYNKSQKNEKDIHQKKCRLYGGWKKIN